MGFFERYLSVWVALCIVAGVALGTLFPAPFQTLGRLEVAQVNLPVAVLIWAMIVPMLLKVEFRALTRVREHWRGVGITVFANWAVKPFSMAVLGWLFVGWLFRRGCRKRRSTAILRVSSSLARPHAPRWSLSGAT